MVLYLKLKRNSCEFRLWSNLRYQFMASLLLQIYWIWVMVWLYELFSTSYSCSWSIVWSFIIIITGGIFRWCIRSSISIYRRSLAIYSILCYLVIKIRKIYNYITTIYHLKRCNSTSIKRVFKHLPLQRLFRSQVFQTLHLKEAFLKLLGVLSPQFFCLSHFEQWPLTRHR